jgi:hypothetical protein
LRYEEQILRNYKLLQVSEISMLKLQPKSNDPFIDADGVNQICQWARCSQKYVIFIISLSCPKFVHPHRKRQFLNTCPEPLLYAIRSNADAIANLTMQKEFTCHTFMELSQKKHTHTHKKNYFKELQLFQTPSQGHVSLW